MEVPVVDEVDDRLCGWKLSFVVWREARVGLLTPVGPFPDDDGFDPVLLINVVAGEPSVASVGAGVR